MNLPALLTSKDFEGLLTPMPRALRISEHVLDSRLGAEDIETHIAFHQSQRTQEAWLSLRAQPGSERCHCSAQREPLPLISQGSGAAALPGRSILWARNASHSCTFSFYQLHL